MKKTTISDVAKMANVSTATVSRILNGNKKVNPAMKKEVLNAIDVLNYKPDNVARSLRSKGSNILGFIIRDISNPNYAIICKGAEKIARKHNYNMILCNSFGVVENEKEHIDLLIQQKVAGVAIYMADDSINTIQPLLDNNIPVVLIDSEIEGVQLPRIRSNSYKGTYEGAKYLLNLGHERIAALAGNENVFAGRERLAGYVDAMMEFEKEPLYYTGGFSKELAYDQTMEILEIKPKVTAILAASNQLSLGSLLALKNREVKIPKDICFLGFDNDDFFSLTDPPISIINRSVEQMGSSAMNILISSIRNKNTDNKPTIYLPIEINHRYSCIPVNQMGGFKK
ncbi:MAG: LacI family transcriptional regulator [Tindallia sp. MSAO_Bac2]|nr:MAG: LacI family transcriptional regulator [Tindallia sp. MSAO_Bac2]